MKLQKGTSLALYSVLEFAANPGRQLSAAEIAEKYGASAHHLAKVLRDLGRAGLVESARGVGGGYRFSGNARRLTLMDVIELFEDISTRTGEIDEIPRATFRSITLDTMLKLIERQRRAATDAKTATKG